MKSLNRVILFGAMFLLFSAILMEQSLAQVEIKFVYPVAAGGPLAKVIDSMVDDFNKEHPDVRVVSIFAGDYLKALQRVQTGVLGGNPPDVAVVGNNLTLGLVDLKALLSLDDFIKREDGQRFLDRFIPSLLTNNCSIKGVYYALPFQFSTPILYYNRDIFRKAGLASGKPPDTWSELLDYAKKLTILEGGKVKQWGFGTVVNNWIGQSYALQNGTELYKDYTHTNYDDPLVIEAFQFFVDLKIKHKVMPFHRSWGKLAEDFIAGNCTMMYNSTGSLGFVRDNVKFDWGTAFLPKNKQYGVPMGGGSIAILQGIPDKNKEAAWKFIKWLVATTENSARWALASGYLAVLKDAWEIKAFKEYTQKVPQALTAKDQLAYAYPQMMVHETGRITDMVNTTLEDVMAEKRTVKDALEDCQRKAEEILKSFRK